MAIVNPSAACHEHHPLCFIREIAVAVSDSHGVDAGEADAAEEEEGIEERRPSAKVAYSDCVQHEDRRHSISSINREE